MAALGKVVRRASAVRESELRQSAMREPQQARGLERVETILDAAAELVAESGVASVTVAELAARARTSKGSLYHFFPDIESVFRALAEQHVAAIRAIVDALREDRSVQWAKQSPDEVTERILTPFRDYVAQHPDLMVLLREPIGSSISSPRSDVLAALSDLVGSVLHARHPTVSSGTNALRAAVMVAIIDGISTTARRLDEPLRSAMPTEMRRVLSAYLRTL